MMKIKAEHMPMRDRLCCLTMDEFSIKPSLDYDIKSVTFLGDVNLPDHDGQATKCLVFQLGGLAYRFKQIVGYFFTGNI